MNDVGWTPSRRGILWACKTFVSLLLPSSIVLNQRITSRVGMRLGMRTGNETWEQDLGMRLGMRTGNETWE